MCQLSGQNDVTIEAVEFTSGRMCMNYIKLTEIRAASIVIPKAL